MSNTNGTILFPYGAEELWAKFREIIQSELQKLIKKEILDLQTPGLVEKPLLKSAEVCEIFRISRQTLHAWVREGILKSYKIKSRTFFLTNDITNLVKTKTEDNTNNESSLLPRTYKL